MIERDRIKTQAFAAGITEEPERDNAWHNNQVFAAIEDQANMQAWQVDSAEILPKRKGQAELAVVICSRLNSHLPSGREHVCWYYNCDRGFFSEGVYGLRDDAYAAKLARVERAFHLLDLASKTHADGSRQ